MPMNNTHINKNGDIIEHRWLHNAYGALQQRSTFRGLLQRDANQLRPFVLTRSFFFGSQRYSGMWTGDSQAGYDDVPLSVNMLLTLGVSGIVFGGTDVPGFFGIPPDDLWVQFYQLGVFYPFFRAHADRTSLMREPWLQSERVQKIVKDCIFQRYA